MNCQQHPSFTESQMKASIASSDTPAESQWKEGELLHANTRFGVPPEHPPDCFRMDLPASIHTWSNCLRKLCTFSSTLETAESVNKPSLFSIKGNLEHQETLQKFSVPSEVASHHF